ncbi:MAG TPA: response regulator [Candidatus Acidoferrales bacterium]|nr:response regulator [Candidatus Acidoferrales bacterium]
METRNKILLLDDDADWLALCREQLAALPSHPEVLTAGNAKRALALLETEKVRLLISDLKMPRIDGLQMIAIVRRRFPSTRTVVLSGLEDEEYRSRAYALGVDLFWLKTEMQRSAKLFNECVESLLGQSDRDGDTGFRGLQSKSLMDIIQMECLSRTSTVLRITRGPLVAKLWIQDGELTDAECEGARGEAACRRILAWKTGTFENLPAEPGRERTIQTPVNALLLESAQSIDETTPGAELDTEESSLHRRTMWKLAQLTREGAEFVVAVPIERGEPEGLGTQNVTAFAQWTQRAAEIARRLGERLEAGPLLHVAAESMERQVVMLVRGDRAFLVGWPAETAENLLEKSRKLVASWES